MTKESRILKHIVTIGYSIDINGVLTNPKGKVSDCHSEERRSVLPRTAKE